MTIVLKTAAETPKWDFDISSKFKDFSFLHETLEFKKSEVTSNVTRVFFLNFGLQIHK